MLNSSVQKSIALLGGRVIDPFSGRDEIADVFVSDGLIAESAPATVLEIDATEWIVCPGLMDIHVHLREPGQTHKETIETGTAAAAAGGFTYVACMPNTAPPIDSPAMVKFVLDRTREVGSCAVGPVATITKGRIGKELADLESLKNAGAVAFSDDGTGVEDDSVMKAAFELAATLNVVLIQHCEYRALSHGGVMHLGDVSKKLGLPGLDPRSEEAMIERDIELCRQTGGRYHVAHISTARAVDLVRAAKREGLPVSAEVCTHHLILTDDACSTADPNAKMHPPLRPQSDVDACRAGLIDGTIDCIVTDHAPHTAKEKGVGFLAAPPGIVGLETALGLACSAMIDFGALGTGACESGPSGSGPADWPSLISWFTRGSSLVLGLDRPAIQPGMAADLTLIGPEQPWEVDSTRFLSRSRNTPFGGWSLPARPVGTILGNRLVTQPGAAV